MPKAKSKTGKVEIQGCSLVFPPHDAPGAYPSAVWLHKNELGVVSFAASISAHYLTNDKKSKHQHWTIKTSDELGKDTDHSRLHVTYGHEIAQVQITGYAELVTMQPPIFRGIDGKTMYRLAISPNGSVKGIPVPHDYIQWSGE
jgi:hypothetical protein